jgi:hypothetical protein
MNKKKNKLTPLPEELRPLLEQVVQKHSRELAARVRAGEFGELNANEYDEIRLSLGKELSETGLDEDDEPNKRGHQIERLIDWVGERIRSSGSMAGCPARPGQ